MKTPELLLPVGNKQMLEAAIKNGADAVYYGVPHFNARGRTEDFNLEDVAEMIQYARIRGVRSFLAMNILVFQDEMEKLPPFLEQVISLKPDAFIVQDIGLARLIKAIEPNQEIHASTQMTLASAEAVNLVKDLGFKRAVLSRELSLKQIQSIKNETDLELEVFVHGALCVSYSVQCLTRENFGGRSANRGQCAQSCRLPYRLFVDGNEVKNKVPYLFSPKDLCALPKLNEMAKIGIESLKVEGRLKSPEYVAAVAKAYRKVLDNNALGESGLESLTKSDMEPLEVLFSRGLYTGWLEGVNHQQLVEGSFSNHHGEYLGTVHHTNRQGVYVEQRKLENKFDYFAEPLPGDGILFEEDNHNDGENNLGARLYKYSLQDQNGKPFGKRTNHRTANLYKNHNPIFLLEFSREFKLYNIKPGMKVYRNDSPALEKELHRTFTEREFDKKIPVKMELYGKIGEPLQLKISDPWGNSAYSTSEFILKECNKDPYKNPNKDAYKELFALSSTPYKLILLNNKTPLNAFIPDKILRSLRQEATEALNTKRTQWKNLKPNAENGTRLLSCARPFQINIPSEKNTDAEISVLVRRPDQIEALKHLPIHNVIMDFDWGVKYDSSLEQIREFGFKAGIATLRIHKPGENHYLKNILRLSPDFALVRSLGALAILKDSGIPLTGDYSLNATNCLSYQWLLSQGLQTLHPSWDLNSAQLFDLLKNINGKNLELAIHQYMPAFHSEYCAFAKSLTTGRAFPECGKICTKHKVEILDHKGERHFLQSDAECRNTLFVGKPQSALKLLPQLKQNGVFHFRLEMLDEAPEIVRQKVQIYAQAIRGKTSIEQAIQQVGVQEKYGLTEGQLFNETPWHDRKKKN